MREKKTIMKTLSELHFSFEVPHITEIEDTKYSIIFTSAKYKPKTGDRRALKSNLVTGKPDKSPSRKSDQKCHTNKYDGGKNIIEKKSDILEKLRSIKTFLSPIVTEITSSASNLTETEIRKLQLNKTPLCKISFETFTAAIEASKLLKEVNAELSERNLLNYPQNTFIVNTLYYPDGDINKESLNFDKHIYVDKGLLKQLLELQKVLANIIDELGLSAGIAETSGSETNESTNKSDVISYPSHSGTTPIYHNSVPQSHSKEKRIKIMDPESEETVEEMVRCLTELSDVRRSLVEENLQKKFDFSNEILLTGSPQVKDCCLKNDVPHLHAKLNGIPVIIKINKETMDTLLKTINKGKNEKRLSKEENKRRNMEKKERKQEEKEKKAARKRTKKDKPNATNSAKSKKKAPKKSLQNTENNDPLETVNPKMKIDDTLITTTTFESEDSINNEVDEGAFIEDEDDDDDGDDGNLPKVKLSERMINRSNSHLRLLTDESSELADLENANEPEKSLSDGFTENSSTKNVLNQSSQTSGAEISEQLKILESGENQNSRTEIKNETSPRDKSTDDSGHSIDKNNKSKNNKSKGTFPKNNSESLRSYHSIDVIDESGSKNEMNENHKTLEDELIASFHDTDNNRTHPPRDTHVKESFDNETQYDTITRNISANTISSNVHIKPNKPKNVMSRSCFAPSKLSLKLCRSQIKRKQCSSKCTIITRNISNITTRLGKKKNPIVCVNDEDISTYSQTDPKSNENDHEYQVMRATTTYEKSFHQIRGFDRNIQMMPCKISEKNKQVIRKPQKQYNFDVPVELLGTSAQKMLFDIRSNITGHFGNVPINISRKEQVRTYVVTLETDGDKNKNNFNETSVFKEQLIIEQTINDDYRIFENKSVSAKIPQDTPKKNASTHPYIDKFKEIGIKNIIDACEPAKCCRRSFLNEFPEPSMPYPPSLMSLPLDDSDLEKINHAVTTNFWYEKFQYYMSLGKDDMQWPSHTYEVRYFVISDGMGEEPTKECKNNNTTEVLYDSAWKYQMYNIKMIRDIEKCKKLLKPPSAQDHLISQSQKKFKDPKSTPVKKAFQTPIETPYSPSAHSLPGVGLIAVPEMYRASRTSLPPSSSNIQMILPLVTTKNKKMFDDDTSLSPEHFATYKENGRGKLSKDSKNMQTSTTFIKKKTIVCAASQTPRKPNCKNSSICARSETAKPEPESAKVELETGSNKCKPCSTVTKNKSNELAEESGKPITVRCSNNSIKNQTCHLKICKYKQSDILNSIASVEITGMRENPSRESTKTDKANKTKKLKSSSSFGSSSKSKGQLETSSTEGKKSTSVEKTLTLKSPSTKSATSVCSKSKTDSKNKPCKQQLKAEKAKNKKSKSISSLGRRKQKYRDEQQDNRTVTLDETGALKRNISKVTTKALADKSLPNNNNVFWALTKIHIFDDGSQELDILDITSTPPGHYMVSDTNNLVLMGQQPFKAE